MPSSSLDVPIARHRDINSEKRFPRLTEKLLQNLGIADLLSSVEASGSRLLSVSSAGIRDKAARCGPTFGAAAKKVPALKFDVGRRVDCPCCGLYARPPNASLPYVVSVDEPEVPEAQLSFFCFCATGVTQSEFHRPPPGKGGRPH